MMVMSLGSDDRQAASVLRGKCEIGEEQGAGAGGQGACGKVCEASRVRIQDELTRLGEKRLHEGMSTLGGEMKWDRVKREAEAGDVSWRCEAV